MNIAECNPHGRRCGEGNNNPSPAPNCRAARADRMTMHFRHFDLFPSLGSLVKREFSFGPLPRPFAYGSTILYHQVSCPHLRKLYFQPRMPHTACLQPNTNMQNFAYLPMTPEPSHKAHTLHVISTLSTITNCRIYCQTRTKKNPVSPSCPCLCFSPVCHSCYQSKPERSPRYTRQWGHFPGIVQ